LTKLTKGDRRITYSSTSKDALTKITARNRVET